MLRIGELARRSGLTVRTLRHYDALGLLVPGGRSEAGQRLYSSADIARLWQVQSLKTLGLSPTDIRAVLDDPTHDPAALLERHIRLVRVQLERQQRLLERLLALQHAPHSDWHTLLEVIQMNQDIQNKVEDMLVTSRRVGTEEGHRFTPEQRTFLQERAEQLGQDRISEVEQAWPQLMAEVVAEMERGTLPTAPEARALAARWTKLVEAFTGGRQDVMSGLRAGYASQTTPQMQQVWDYIGAAQQAEG